MQCNYVKERMADLFDESLSMQERENILQHASHCSICALEVEAMNFTSSALSSTLKISASDSLKQEVMKTLNGNSEMRKLKKSRIASLMSPTWQKIAGLAAVLLIAFILLPILGSRLFDNNASARSLLSKSIEAIAGIKSVIMTFEVRSIPGDNFDQIDTKGDFINHKLWKVFGNPGKWKIEKPGITVAMDGTRQYKYMEKKGLGYVGSPKVGFVEWLRIFLSPAQILQAEQDYAREHKVKYTIDKTAGERSLRLMPKHWAISEIHTALILLFLNRTIAGFTTSIVKPGG